MEDWVTNNIERIIDSPLKEPIIRQHQCALKLKEALPNVGIIRAKMDLHNRYWIYQPSGFNQDSEVQTALGGEVVQSVYAKHLTSVCVMFPAPLTDLQVLTLDADEFHMIFHVVEPSPDDPTSCTS